MPPGKPNPKTLEAVNRQAMRIWKEQSLETCPNCGRSFHARALRAHLEGCHGSQDQFLGAVRGAGAVTFDATMACGGAVASMACGATPTPSPRVASTASRTHR